MSDPTGHIFENLEIYFIFSLYRKWDSKALTHFSSYEIKLLPQWLYCTISREGFFTTRNRNTKSVEKKITCFLLSHRGNSSSSLTDLAGTYLNTHPQLLQQVNQKKGAVELCHTCISPSNMCSAVTGRNLATLIKYTEFSPGTLTLARPFKRDPEDPNCLSIHTKLLTLSFECSL